jgi:UDP:flavonoid glycosyltransferase YjiC (YdhE family)
VIHHGGLGTTVGALRAGRASVVVPQAFDQSFSAALVERAGVGVAASVGDVGCALETVLAQPAFGHAAAEMSARLVSPRVAASRVAERVLAVAGGASVLGR